MNKVRWIRAFLYPLPHFSVKVLILNLLEVKYSKIRDWSFGSIIIIELAGTVSAEIRCFVGRNWGFGKPSFLH